MEDKKLEVPYIVYEGEQARHERTIKRLIIALVVSVILIAVTNVAWLLYMSGFEYYGMDDEITVEAKDGIANFIGENGIIRNGTDNSETARKSIGQEEWQSTRD